MFCFNTTKEEEGVGKAVQMALRLFGNDEGVLQLKLAS